jgi:hypothetical protein
VEAAGARCPEDTFPSGRRKPLRLWLGESTIPPSGRRKPPRLWLGESTIIPSGRRKPLRL